MFVIGIDPHRGSHAAAALDEQEHVQAVLHLAADRQQRQRLLAWAEAFVPRVWAVEGATGTGALLAQQLVAAGEAVLDVPPKLAARVRLLDNNHSDKTDTHDACSAAIVALRNNRLRAVILEDYTAVLRLLAKRHLDLIAARTRAMCRLHTTVHFLVAGHLPRRLKASAGGQHPRRHPPDHGDRHRAQNTGARPADRDPTARSRARRPRRTHPRCRHRIRDHRHRPLRGRVDRRRLPDRLQR
jgi:hypothetical protein